MAELDIGENQRKPSIRIPFDLKLVLPYALLFASWVVAYIRAGDSADVVRMQVQADQQTIQKLSESVSTLSERLARVESMSDRLARVETKLDNYIDEQAVPERHRR